VQGEGEGCNEGQRHLPLGRATQAQSFACTWRIWLKGHACDRYCESGVNNAPVRVNQNARSAETVLNLPRFPGTGVLSGLRDLIFVLKSSLALLLPLDAGCLHQEN